MIGRPENDLRHIGHVGYDGVTFGDVSFIGDDYSKLQPVSTAGNNRGDISQFITSLKASNIMVYTMSKKQAKLFLL